MLSTIYGVLSIVELIVILAFGVFVFVGRDKTWNLHGRFFAVLTIVLINLVQIPLDFMLEQSCVLSIIMVILLGMDVVIYYSEIKKNKSKK